MLEFSQEITVRLPFREVSEKVVVDSFRLEPAIETTDAGTQYRIDHNFFADTLPRTLQFGYPVDVCVDIADTAGNTYTIGTSLMPARLLATRHLNRWILSLSAVSPVPFL